MAEGTPEYVDHPLLEPGVIEDRPYQNELVEAARDEHTLVSLPTGLGKTTVSLRVTADRLHEDRGAKSLLLAPTKPLVEQHAGFYRNVLEIDAEEIVVFTGETRPEDREALWTDARVVIATPQVVENDLVGNRISLADVVHCTFDECHRATGDYAYTYIAERYHRDATDPLVTGMSASPGDDEESIRQVMVNLGLTNVAVKTEDDPDVAEYTYDTEVEWQSVPLPEPVIEMRDLLKEVVADRLETLKELGVAKTTDPDLSQKDLNTIRAKLQRLMDDGDSAGYEGMSIHAEVMKLRRAVELVETQSVDALRRYFERQRNAADSSGASKASQRLVSDSQVKRAMAMAEDFDDLHPKFEETRTLLAQTLGLDGGERIIVFTESRDTAEALTEFLDGHFDVRRFVGQAQKDGSPGMTQKQQKAVLEDFRAGEFEVLVSTSVAEEGLDVPEVDLVLFFEPVPTAIRSVQRKGRTGRQTEGRVVVLMAEDTRDEAYFWISRRREQEMEDELETLRNVADEVEAVVADQQVDIGAFEGGGEGESGVPEAGSDEAEPTPHSATETSGEGTESGAMPAQQATTDGRGQYDLEDFQSDTEASGPAEEEDEEVGGDEGDTEDEEETNESVEADEEETNESAEADEEETDAEGSGTSSESDARPKADEEDRPENSAANSREVESDSQPENPSDEAATGDQDPESAGVVASPSSGDGIEIVIDQRELDSGIAQTLSLREGVETRLETLAVGDYVLSDRVAVERKTIQDFNSTLFDGDRSLFDQAGDMGRHYARPVLIIEGDGDLYAERNADPNSIRGALASLAVDFGISVLRSRSEDDTVELLRTIAKREQEKADREVSVHGEKAQKTLAEQQEYVVSSIADIGPVTARSLLDALGSVEAVLTADEEELQEVRGVGEVTANRIREVVGTEYSP